MRAASALVPTLAFEMGVTIPATPCLWQSNISPLKCSRNKKLSDIAHSCVPRRQSCRRLVCSLRSLAKCMALLCVYRVDGELRAGGMASRAALTQRVGISQEVRRFGLGNVTSAASRSCRLHRIDPALGIGYLIQAAHQRQIILLRTIDVAHGAVLQISG